MFLRVSHVAGVLSCQGISNRVERIQIVVTQKTGERKKNGCCVILNRGEELLGNGAIEILCSFKSAAISLNGAMPFFCWALSAKVCQLQDRRNTAFISFSLGCINVYRIIKICFISSFFFAINSAQILF